MQATSLSSISKGRPEGLPKGLSEGRPNEFCYRDLHFPVIYDDDNQSVMHFECNDCQFTYYFDFQLLVCHNKQMNQAMCICLESTLQKKKMSFDLAIYNIVNDPHSLNTMSALWTDGNVISICKMKKMGDPAFQRRNSDKDLTAFFAQFQDKLMLLKFMHLLNFHEKLECDKDGKNTTLQVIGELTPDIFLNFLKEAQLKLLAKIKDILSKHKARIMSYRDTIKRIEAKIDRIKSECVQRCQDTINQAMQLLKKLNQMVDLCNLDQTYQFDPTDLPRTLRSEYDDLLKKLDTSRREMNEKEISKLMTKIDNLKIELSIIERIQFE